VIKEIGQELILEIVLLHRQIIYKKVWMVVKMALSRPKVVAQQMTGPFAHHYNNANYY
jgi:hypothetical protein